MDYVHLTQDKLNIEEISNLVASPTCGAISIFVGTTRNHFENKTVVKLEYEVYESMAIKCMKDICGDLRKKWNALENIAIYHRYGTVPVKEASVVIAISSPHREDAIEATQAGITNVKKSVPIWKKEVYKDCASDWKENKESVTYPPRIRFFKLDQKPQVQVSYVPPHLIQIKVDAEEIEHRIQKFIERKREEVNASNIRDFCPRDDPNYSEEFSCARVDAKLYKRKDSNSHLQVKRSFNEFYRDQFDTKYLKKYQPKNGVEERLQNIEIQLGFSHPTKKDIYERIKKLEDRLLHIESVSPEYMQFFGKNIFQQERAGKKRIFSISEIDSMISQLESKKFKTSLSDEDSKNI